MGRIVLSGTARPYAQTKKATGIPVKVMGCQNLGQRRSSAPRGARNCDIGHKTQMDVLASLDISSSTSMGLVYRKTAAERKPRPATSARQKERRLRLSSRRREPTGQPLPTQDLFEALRLRVSLRFQENSHSQWRLRRESSRGKRYIREEGIIVKYLKPSLGPEIQLAAIRRSDVIRYIHKRTAKVSDGTVHQETKGTWLPYPLVARRPAQDRGQPGPNATPMPQAPEGLHTLAHERHDEHRVLTARSTLPPVQNEKGEVEEQDQRREHAVGSAVALGTRRGEPSTVTLLVQQTLTPGPSSSTED